MEEESIKTSDLYYGAYLLVKGNPLSDVFLTEERHKRYVVFYFKGKEELFQSALEYLSGRAKANVNELRGHIDHLKRLTYQKLNKN